MSSAVFICGECGTGKAQPLHARVLTPSGWTTMGNISPGDMVCTPDGGYAKVVGVYPQGAKEIWRITFSDDSWAECTEDHLWYVTTPEQRWRCQPGKVKTLREIRSSYLGTNVRSSGKLNRRYFIPITEPIIWPAAELPIDPYLLGLLLGDGGMSQISIDFTTADAELLAAVEKLLPKDVKVRRKSKYGNALTAGRRGGHKNHNSLVQTLRSLGLLGKKSEAKFVPDIYKYASIQQRVAILQGLFDSDGCPDQSMVDFCVSSRRLASDVQEIVQSLGGTARIRTKPTSHLTAYRMSIVMPSGFHPFRLLRKAEKFRHGTKYRPARSIADISPSGMSECRCIAIDHPSHLYVTDNFVVTHNTLMGASAAHQVGRHLNKKYLALVVGPPHLTRKGRRGSKWAREIMGTIPGAHVFHVETPGDLLAAHDLARHRTGPLWIIASRNALKMGPPFEGQYVMKSGLVESSDGDQKIRRRVKAPHCPRCGTMVLNANDEPASQKWLASAKRSCRKCGEQLWQYTWRKDDKGNCKTDAPLFLPSDYIKRKMQFDIGIFDEIHELKGGDTAQGSMLGAVASRCRRVICLTGTLYGGKASDLYFLLWRTCAERMKALGYEYTSGLKRFIETYGIRQRVVEKGEERSGRRSKKKSGGDIVVEKPGIVPTLYTDFLLDKAMFLSLDELAPHVPNSVLPDRPPIEMIKVPLGELNDPYQAMHTDIVAAIKESSRGGLPNMGLMSALYSGCDCWPDHPYGFDDVTMLVRGEDGESVERVHVCTPPTMPEKMYNKDKAVVDFLKAEVQQGRKCLLYCVHTVKHQVPQRLATYLDAAGIRYSILEGVDTSHREDWVAEQVRKGVDVIITHPQKVETGLDLLDFPTIVFHSMGLKPFTFRQAGARAWRIGQQKRCRIVVFAYEGTMQEMIAGAMFTKCRASTRLEGQVLADLSALSAENDITDEILEHVKKGTQPMVTTEVEVELERSTSEVLYIDDLPGCEPAESPAVVTLVPGVEDQDDSSPVEDLDAWAKNLFGDSLHAVMSR